MATVTGGNITVTPQLTMADLHVNADGSSTLVVAVLFNGARRERVLGISSTGATFTVDGVTVAAPDAMLQALGLYAAGFAAKLNASVATATFQTLVTAP